MQETNTNTNQDSLNDESALLPAHELSAARVLASSGFHTSLIAQTLGLSVWDLYGPHADELDSAAEIKAKNTIDRSLYEMAASKKNNAATALWVKSYGHPATTPPPASADKPEKKKPYVWNPNDPNDRVIFSVYNNDGEPNHDY